MNRTDVQGWLDRYVEAWRANQPELVEALFTADAVYRFRPYGGEGRVVSGLPEIVTAWIEESAEPEGSVAQSFEASYRPYAVDGDRAVATGISRYLDTDSGGDETYHNCFLLRFAPDGRCAEFTEYWMLEPKEDEQG